MTRTRLRCAIAIASIVWLAALSAPAAFAHKDAPPPKPPAEKTMPPAEETMPPVAEKSMAPGELDGSVITVAVKPQAALGEEVRIEARLTSDEGEPIADALIEFLSPASWGEEVEGEMVLGTARTDRDGKAFITTVLRREGDVEVHASFAGDAHFKPVEADAEVRVAGHGQLYDPAGGVHVPGLGGWIVAAVVATVWFLYFVAARRAAAIARPAVPARIGSVDEPTPTRGIGRRTFLGGIAVPVGRAAILGLGSGLVALVVRSPRTHANLGRRPPGGYRRTDIAFVGHTGEMAELPPLLQRQVSFAREVAPILMSRGGPHVMLPENSSPPNRVRLDAYEHIMEREGLVVPGKPMESMLVTVLIDPAMAMPPGLPPLPESEIQIVASWVAQGAKKN